MKHAELFKALGDPNRLQILNMLCNGELCACMLLKKFNISQPTLSHHMKILCDCGIVNKRKEGKWTYYSINPDGCERITLLVGNFLTIMDCKCSNNSFAENCKTSKSGEKHGKRTSTKGICKG